MNNNWRQRILSAFVRFFSCLEKGNSKRLQDTKQCWLEMNVDGLEHSKPLLLRERNSAKERKAGISPSAKIGQESLSNPHKWISSHPRYRFHLMQFSAKPALRVLSRVKGGEPSTLCKSDLDPSAPDFSEVQKTSVERQERATRTFFFSVSLLLAVTVAMDVSWTAPEGPIRFLQSEKSSCP